MKTIVTLLMALLLCQCGGDFSTIDAEVEIVGSLPPVMPSTKSDAVLYRVVTPAELTGRYGVEYTKLSSTEVEQRKGAIFKIRRIGKWRHLLTASAPIGASVSAGEDFFDSATQK
jgi:hypothetical protein